MELHSLTEILGDIDQSEQQFDWLRPLDNPSLLHAFKIEYTYDSKRVEGDTLTLRETELVIENGQTLAGKPEDE